MGVGIRGFVAFVLVAALGAPALAQGEDKSVFSAPHGTALPGTRSYFGVNLGRAYTDTNCPATVLFCDRDRSAQMYAGTMFDKHWGAELGYVDTGRFARPTGESRSQALSVSLVGRAQVLPKLGVFGKVGTAYGRPDTSVMGNAAASGPDTGFGLAYGGGISYDLSPSLSATLEWGSYDLHVGAGPVRTGTLGVQYRY
jgi:opacity protein-like surface antigen